MKSRIIQYATITLIALLVWLYAEGATRKLRDVTVTLRFVSPAGQAQVISPNTQTVTMSVRSATSQLQDLNELAQTGLEIEVTARPGEPNQQVLLASRLNNHDAITRMGVTVDRVEPDTVSLRVEPLKTVTMRVELVTPADLELSGPPQFGREQVNVTMPASNAAQVDNAEWKLLARLDANALTGVVPGVQQERELELTLPAPMAQWQNVMIEPETRKVRVTFTVKKKVDEVTVPNVPVYLYIMPTYANQYSIAVDQESLALRDVKLAGPNDLIAAIREGSTKIEAVLRLEPGDLENQINSKPPELRLPPGVTTVTAPPLIKMTITRRESTLQ